MANPGQRKVKEFRARAIFGVMPEVDRQEVVIWFRGEPREEKFDLGVRIQAPRRCPAKKLRHGPSQRVFPRLGARTRGTPIFAPVFVTLMKQPAVNRAFETPQHAIGRSKRPHRLDFDALVDQRLYDGVAQSGPIPKIARVIDRHVRDPYELSPNL